MEVVFEYKENVVVPPEPVDETEIPYISIYYYNPKPTDAEDIIIPLYFTDFYQKEYYDDDFSLCFKLRYEVDGVVKYIENLPAGDYNLNLGKLPEGMHWYSAQVEDVYGRVSRRIFNDLWVINEANYAIKPSEIHTITDEDLTTYKINKNNSEIEEDMINNRIGLSQLFEDLRGNGIRKVILPLGTYRVNRCIRLGTIANKDCPIIIPSGLTVDMNGATFKMHPYDDRQYGNRGQVQNLILRIDNGIDSHLLNGIIEGNYFEKQKMTWYDDSNALSSYNGEGDSGIYIYANDYSSLDSITIKQVTGYNVYTSQDGSYGWGKIGTWTDNLAIINGLEISKDGYVTCNYCTMDDKLLASNYVVASVWLMYGGLRGKYWDMDFHFYDTEYKFIESIKVYQFTRCRIPTNSKYLRITFRATSNDMVSLSLHHMKLPHYSSINNCHWLDNRTCAAPFQFQHLQFTSCTFTRSGSSITPCCIDIEDGWEQSQDFFMDNCSVTEIANGSTAGLIVLAGLNYNISNCSNLDLEFRNKVNGVKINNCTAPRKAAYSVGFSSCNAFYCNTLSAPLYLYNNYNGKLRVNYVTGLTNCINNSSVKSYYPTFYFESNWFTGADMSTTDGKQNFFKYFPKYFIGSNYVYCGNNWTIDGKVVDVHVGKNALFDTYNGFTTMDLRIHSYLHRYIFDNNTIFKKDTIFSSGHNFLYLVCNHCTFQGTMSLNPNKNNNMGDISFNNYVFEKVVTINLTNGSKAQFNECIFKGQISFKNSGQQNSEFNNCITQ